MKTILAILTVLTFTSALQAQSPVPSDYQPIYSQLDQILTMFNDKLNETWDGTRTNVDTADESIYGSSNNGLTLFDPHNIQEMQTEISRMKLMGLSSVSLSIHFPYLYPDFWVFAGTPEKYQEMAQFYANVANYVRGHGMKVVVETQTIFADDSEMGTKVKDYYASLDWNGYMAARQQTAINIANIVKPDYFTLISEPDTEADLTGQTNLNTVEGVMQLVTPMAAAVKGLNIPGMKIGAGSGTWVKNFSGLLGGILQNTVADYYSLHLYPITGDFMPLCVQAAREARKYGKSTAIGETWAYKISSYEYGNGISPFSIFRRDPYDFWAPIDSKALKVFLKMANMSKMMFISPFWTRYLFSYVPYNDDTKDLLPQEMDQLAHDTAEAAMNAGQFSSTGRAWSGYVKGTIPLD